LYWLQKWTTSISEVTLTWLEYSLIGFFIILETSLDSLFDEQGNSASLQIEDEAEAEESR
tara:strand:- start:8245 stop:8424 length:180 start_codon:yes stop_codon:yes gene_type:complete